MRTPLSRRKLQARESRRGTILVMAVVTVFFVFAFCMGFVQLSQATTKRQNHAVDTKQAFYLAEVGLAEAYAGLAVAKTGNVGTPAQPAAIGNGLFWVEANDLGNNVVQLESTALYGRGRVTLALAAERVPARLTGLGFFTSGDLSINPDVFIDSYDSSQGSYPEQLAAGVNLDQAIVGSNGDVSASNGVIINGDVVHGVAGSASLGGATVTGTVGARAAPVTLPPVEVPAIPLAPGVVASDPAAPLVLPPGTIGLDSLFVDKDARAVLTGPATIVVRELTTASAADLVFDSRDGPIDLYVIDSINLGMGSTASTVSSDTSRVTIQVAGTGTNAAFLGASSTFYGHIYAPAGTAKVVADFEVFGSVVALDLNFSAQGRLHMDLNDGLDRRDVLPPMWSWRVLEIPSALASKGGDPFKLLGLDRSTLPLPKDAHQEQQLSVVYEDLSGATQNYDGLESAFDWTQVSLVIEGTRDGTAFEAVPPPESAGTAEQGPTLTPEEQALVDMINSPLTSAELTSALLNEGVLTSAVLLEALRRTPPMDGWDVYYLLEKSGPYIPSYPNGQGTGPLSEEILMAAVRESTMDSQALAWALEQSSPLPAAVLDAAVNRDPAMKNGDLNRVLGAQ